jgi:hypothetical protein
MQIALVSLQAPSYSLEPVNFLRIEYEEDSLVRTQGKSIKGERTRKG